MKRPPPGRDRRPSENTGSVHGPHQRGACDTRDRRRDASRIPPRKRQRSCRETEPPPGPCPSSVAHRRLGSEPKPGRERHLRAIRAAGFRDQEQRRQGDERERAARIGASTSARRPSRLLRPRETRAPRRARACGEGEIRVNERTVRNAARRTRSAANAIGARRRAATGDPRAGMRAADRATTTPPAIPTIESARSAMLFREAVR